MKSEEDYLLTALLDLEAKLAEDLARKPKHQKITLQREWQQQIDELNSLLGLRE